MPKPPLVALTAALLARLAVLLLVVLSGANAASPRESRAFNGGDSEHYIVLAQNMVEHGVFSLDTAPPFTPDLIRTPGYPLLLASLYALAGMQHNPALIVLAQVALSVANVWLVAALGERLFSRSAARLAAWLYALAPAALVFTGLVMTETLFATLMLASLLLLLHIPNAAGRRAWAYAAAVGLCWAASVYVRPIGLYTVPILLLALALQNGWRRRTLGLALVVLAVYAAGLAPWYARNYAHYRAVLFTSLANQNLLMYNVASIEAQRQGISWREAKDRLWDDFGQRLEALQIASPDEAQTSKIMGDMAFERILADPVSAALFQLADTANALRPGYSMAAMLLRDDPNELGGEVQAGNLEAITDSAPHELAIFGLMTAYYALLYLAALAGALLLAARWEWLALAVCGLLPFWFLFQAGAAGNARFRAPLEGLLALLAAVGLAWAAQTIGRRVRPSRALTDD